jgi:hypothetical protein
MRVSFDWLASRIPTEQNEQWKWSLEVKKKRNEIISKEEKAQKVTWEFQMKQQNIIIGIVEQ